MKLIIDFTERLIRVKRLILNRVLLDQRIVQIILASKDRNKRIILNFHNIYYILNSLLLYDIDLSFVNNISIYYNNK